MAKVRKDDVQELWNETPRHDWSNFRRTLEKHRGQKDNIEDSKISAMLLAVEDLEKSGQNFPESFDMFYQMINQKVDASGRSLRNEGEGRTQGVDRESGGRSSRGDGEARNQSRDSGGGGRGDGESRSQSKDSGERGGRGDGESRGGRGDGESRGGRGDGESRGGRGDGEEQSRGGKK